MEFAYGEHYLQRPDDISLWEAELPLRRGWSVPDNSTGIASCLRDASPDNWGRRVTVDRVAGRRAMLDGFDLDEFDYLREASSDRIGAIDVQDSHETYVPRHEAVTLERVMEAAQALEQNESLPEAVRVALDSRTGVGGAQPKALLEYRGRPVVAKFSTSDARPDLPAVPAPTPVTTCATTLHSGTAFTLT